MKIIAFVGKARSGKDTCGDHLAAKYGFGKYALAGPLKEMLHVGLGLDPKNYQTTEQKEAVIPGLDFSYRHAAQTLGTEWGRVHCRDDLWLLIADRRLGHAREQGLRGISIIDMRFENEAAWCRAQGGRIVHVQSDRALAGMSTKAAAHVSEHGVYVREGDIVLPNNGELDELYLRLDEIAEMLHLEVV